MDRAHRHAPLRADFTRRRTLQPAEVGTVKAGLVHLAHTSTSPPRKATWHSSSPTRRAQLAPTDRRSYLAHAKAVLDEVHRRAAVGVVGRFLRGWARQRRAEVRAGRGLVGVRA